MCSKAVHQRKIQLKHFRFRHAIAWQRTHPLRKFASMRHRCRRTLNALRAAMDVFDILDR
ncbi:MAG: hypothetical protein E5X28_09865, partial [Mesorhizobium sp.]